MCGAGDITEEQTQSELINIKNLRRQMKQDGAGETTEKGERVMNQLESVFLWPGSGES